MAIMLDQEDSKKPLYTNGAIVGGTFFGGPLVTGILMRANFYALNKKQEGNRALLFSIIATLVLIAISLFIPEKAGRSLNLLPIIYTAGARALVTKYFGETYKMYEEAKIPFHPIWKSIGVTLVGLAIVVGTVFASVYAFERFNPNTYDTLLAEFGKNEEEAVKLDNMMGQESSDESILNFVEDKATPLWKRNVEITKEMDKVEGLDASYSKQNKILREYSELRLNYLDILTKLIKEKNEAYNTELNKIVDSINKKLEELESNK